MHAGSVFYTPLKIHLFYFGRVFLLKVHQIARACEVRPPVVLIPSKNTSFFLMRRNFVTKRLFRKRIKEVPAIARISGVDARNRVSFSFEKPQIFSRSLNGKKVIKSA